MSRSVVVLRSLIWLAGGAALWAAVPRTVPLSPIALPTLAILLAALPAVLPGRWPPLGFGVLLIVCWIGRTAVLAEGVDPIALLVLAIAWYAQHSLCALAAVVPRDAIVLPEVYLRWSRRSAPAFLAAVVGVTLTVLLTPTTFGEATAFGESGALGWRDAAPLGLVLAGLLLVPALAWIPARLLRRGVQSDPAQRLGVQRHHDRGQ